MIQNKQQPEQQVTTISGVNDNHKKQDNKLTLLVVLISTGMILTVGLIVGCILLGLYFRGKGNSDNTSYVVPNGTEERYEHLLTYINNERTSAGLSNADKIVSFEFKDNDFYVSYSNENEPGFMRIETSNSDVNTFLNTFTDRVPSTGTYGTEINIMTYNNTLSVNVTSETKVGYVSTYLGNNYLSATYMNLDGSISSLSKTAYLESGSYPEGMRANKSDNQLVYGLLYYILFK